MAQVHVMKIWGAMYILILTAVLNSAKSVLSLPNSTLPLYVTTK